MTLEPSHPERAAPPPSAEPEPDAAHAQPEAPPATPRVEAIIPAWNNPGEILALLSDFAHLDPAGASLHLTLIDNASTQPLADHPEIRQRAQDLPFPVTFQHLPTNTGGSGGYNAGLSRALQNPHTTHAWLVDSDVRLEADTLRHLLMALEEDETAVAVGAAIHDPDSGEIFECGGRLDRRSGRIEAALPNDTNRPLDYVAACCALVRADAARQAGLFPNTFIHSDDVMFCQRLTRATGGTIIAEPKARCTHPRFDRFKTWARYYEARNWIGPARLGRVGPIGRFRRAVREVALAVEQVMVGSDDLARLHVLGLRDASAGHITGKPSADRLRVGRFWPWHALEPTLRAIIPTIPDRAAGTSEMHADAPIPRNWRPRVGALLRESGFELHRTDPAHQRSLGAAVRGLIRLIITPSSALAFVHARGRPGAWAAGNIIIAAAPQGFRVHTLRPIERLAALTGVFLSSIRPLALLTLSPPEAPPAERPAAAVTQNKPTLSVIILTRDRIDQLLHTLKKLREDETGRNCEIVVVDNASTDGTPSRIQREFPDVIVVPTGANLGVEGFNRGVKASSGDAVLILDDDAWPDEGALEGVIDLLHQRPDVAGVMMHRQHPRTSEYEWPFTRVETRTPRWPDMGSGNVIRRRVWDEVGGYESGYFLYRNDTDLALKLLAAGHEVVFTPECKVWHDSPIAKTKTAKWLFRSTRNWVWLAKRHGKRGSGLAAILMGWLWAHKLAGLSPVKHASALRGMLAGVFSKAPKLEESVNPDGKALSRLIRLKLGLR